MNKTILIISCLALTASLSAQIKIFPGGLQSYGSTTVPTGSVKHRFSGDVVVGQLPGSTETAYIRGGNNTASTAGTPDYTWLSNITTGLFHPAVNTIGFTIAGVERFRLNTNGQIIFNNAPTSWAPDIAWTGDPSTGIFHPAAQSIGFSIGGYEKMRISNNGNVIIGNTSDDNNQKCLITGVSDKTVLNMYDTHTYDYGYAFISNVNRATTKAIAVIYNGVEKFTVRGNGDVFTTTGYYISDRSLKDNIDSIPNALNKILQLKGVTYNFKAEQLKNNAMPGTILATGIPKKEIGLIAQDVELVLPEVVGTMDNGLKAVAYQNLVPLLIEAIKEQNKTINSLQKDVNNCCSKSTGGKSNRTIQNDDDNSSNEDAKSYMKQNKPNPFNKETVIEYNIVESGNASILVFDMTGRLLKTINVKIPGKGSVTINASDFKAGMYYYSLVVNDTEIDTKKMILTE